MVKSVKIKYLVTYIDIDKSSFERREYKDEDKARDYLNKVVSTRKVAKLTLHKIEEFKINEVIKEVII